LQPGGAREAGRRQREDALAHLPRKEMARIRRGQVIYDQTRPSAGIYLVVQGRVKACVTVEDGTQAALGIYGPDSFFGEAGLIGPAPLPERTIALDDVTLMAWTRAEIEDHVEHNPLLGIALMQLAVGRCLDLVTRLEALANDKTPARVARAVAEFGERLGSPTEDGSMHVAPLTHQLIAEYVGTSREIVTFQMNQLRKLGLVRYSRRGMDVYLPALKDHLKSAGLSAAS
jgi:CRP/FNR family transcriptional regulator, cyclic AMP receptor protein